MRIAIPTKDRQGNLSICLVMLSSWTSSGDELYLYDDGDRAATADYAARFALDIATQRGANVTIKRGKPTGIAQARANILRDALQDNVSELLMVDDDIIMDYRVMQALVQHLEDNPKVVYAVPVIALANNEAGVHAFGVTDYGEANHQQHTLGKTGSERIQGGAWTSCILFNLDRFNVEDAIYRLETGPKVVEDYALTSPLIGNVVFDHEVWHCMGGEQRERQWEGMALEELRKLVPHG